MAIQFNCPNCGKGFKVPQEAAGKAGTCKGCGAKFRVPAPEAEAAPPPRRLQPPSLDQQRIARHIAAHLGSSGNVLPAFVDDPMRIDVHIIPPSKKFPWHTLVTNGMSSRGIQSQEFGESDHVEVVMCLPADWDLSLEGITKDEFNWPLGWLRVLSVWPHEFDTTFGLLETIAEGDPPEPLDASTAMSAWMLLPPLLFPEEFYTLLTGHGKQIHFRQVLPLYADELAYRRRHPRRFLAMLDGLTRKEWTRLDRRNLCGGGMPGRLMSMALGRKGTSIMVLLFLSALGLGYANGWETKAGKNANQSPAIPKVDGTPRMERPSANGRFPRHHPRADRSRMQPPQRERRATERPPRERAASARSSQPTGGGNVTVQPSAAPSASTSIEQRSSQRPAPATPSRRSAFPPEKGIIADRSWTPAVGESAEAFWGSKWYPVTILEVTPEGGFKIHYEGYSSGFDEVVPRDRLRKGP